QKKEAASFWGGVWNGFMEVPRMGLDAYNSVANPDAPYQSATFQAADAKYKQQGSIPYVDVQVGWSTTPVGAVQGLLDQERELQREVDCGQLTADQYWQRMMGVGGNVVGGTAFNAAAGVTLRALSPRAASGGPRLVTRTGRPIDPSQPIVVSGHSMELPGTFTSRSSYRFFTPEGTEITDWLANEVETG